MFGRRAALAALAEPAPAHRRAAARPGWPAGAQRADARARCGRTPGLVRDADGLRRLLADPHPLARLIGASALAREESRGCHLRADHPRRDPDLDGRHLVVGGSGDRLPETGRRARSDRSRVLTRALTNRYSLDFTASGPHCLASGKTWPAGEGDPSTTQDAHMYQFSRAIYRELAPLSWRPAPSARSRPTTSSCCSECESAIERLVTDRRHFARPARTLFTTSGPTSRSAT